MVLESELALTDIVKVKYWGKAAVRSSCSLEFHTSKSGLSGAVETYSQIHRQAHNIADERLLTAVQLKLLIYLAYSLFLRSPCSCSLQMIQGNIHTLETSIANLN